MATGTYALLLATTAMAILISFTPLPTSAMQPPLSPHSPPRSSNPPTHSLLPAPSPSPSPSPSQPYPPWRRGEKTFHPSDLYLLYPPSPCDLWVGVRHRAASLSCQTNEAALFRRVLALDLNLRIPKEHNGGVMETRPLELYFDLPYLRHHVAVIEVNSFLKGWKQWDRTHSRKKATLEIVPIRLGNSTAVLSRSTATVVKREYSASGMYGFLPCRGPEGLSEVVQAIRYATPLRKIAETILLDLPKDTVGLHVRRGDKLKLKEKYPHLHSDTQPAHIMEVLRARKIPKGRMIYIATNEREDFFQPLSAVYELRFLSYYSHLWAPNSSWWNSTLQSLGGRGAPKFDVAMQGIVDYSIMHGLKIQLETFNDLTPDPR